MPTLVAITTRLLLPRALSHLPMIASDSPPRCCGTHFEYTSAVSMQSKPAARKPSSSLKDVASSAVHPSTLPPKIKGAISSPEFPSLRFCMVLPVLGCGGLWRYPRGCGIDQPLSHAPAAARKRELRRGKLALLGLGRLAIGGPAAADFRLHPGFKARARAGGGSAGSTRGRLAATLRPVAGHDPLRLGRHLHDLAGDARRDHRERVDDDLRRGHRTV